VSESAIMGKKLFHIPYVGYVATFMNSIAGIFLFIVLPLLIYAGITLYQSIIDKNKKEAPQIKGRNHS